MKKPKNNQPIPSEQSFWRSREAAGVYVVAAMILIIGILSFPDSSPRQPRPDSNVTPTPVTTFAGELEVEDGDKAGLGNDSPALGLQGGVADSASAQGSGPSAQSLQTPQSPQGIQDSQNLQGNGSSSQ